MVNTIEIQKIQKSYYCDSSNYGWNNPEHTEVYCELSIPYTSNVTGETEYHTPRNVFSVSDEYYFETEQNSATIFWNQSNYVTKIINKDITNLFNYQYHETLYGNHIYYVDDVTFKANKDYNFRFEVGVNKNKLPVKYTICFGDMNAHQLYFCLDPTLTDATTWTTKNDFENNTTLNNLTALNGDIRLNIEVNITDGIAHWKFDGDLTDSIDSKDWTDSSSSDTGSGKINNGREFDGSSSSIYLNGVKKLAIQSDAQPFSVNMWIYPDVLGSGILYDEHASSDGGFAIRQFSTNKINVWYSYDTIDSSRTGSIILNTAGWQMVTVTYNGTTLKSYINGTEDINSNLDIDTQNTNDIRFGRWSHDPSSYYNGKADELSVWNNYALTQSEVTDLYNLGRGVSHPFYNKYYTQGLYSDRQGWTTDGSDTITDISIQVENISSGEVKFRYNQTNSSLDNSSWFNLTNGKNDIDLDIDGNSIYYQFYFLDDGNSTPKITSYTINIDEYVTELNAATAIQIGIQQSSIGQSATTYSNQQIYLRNLANTQFLNTVDNVVISGNQRWLFNYNNAGTIGLFNISPVVFVLDATGNMTMSTFSEQITTFIDNTVS